MTTKKLFFISTLSGLLLFSSWPSGGFAPLLLFAFVPLLMVEHEIFTHREKYKPAHIFLYSCWAFFLWNSLTTWWIYNASLFGALMATLLNTFLMAIVFWFFHLTKKKAGEKFSALILVCYWLTFEFLHTNWDVSWSWLTLGNGFASYYELVQWYEFTGVFGGSLWILLVNSLIFEWWNKKVIGYRLSVIGFKLVPVLFVITIPVMFSYLIGSWYGSNITADKKKIDVVIVQPNIDPYNEKFSGNYDEQLKKMLLLAEQKIDSNTDYLVLPETALQEDIWENNIENTFSIHCLKEFIIKYPKLKIVAGASTHYQYQKGEKTSVTAKKFRDADEYYDSYNTAIQIDSSGKIQVYHKSKLVPGVEKMPYPAIFGFLEKFALDFGGTSGSLGTQEERGIFSSPNGNVKIAPVICYESVYGEYVTDYIKKGADFIFILTNDGWWGDTPGYKQHLSYASVRAIENRRWIARSANTGISCFVSPEGELIQKTQWWKEAVIKRSITVEQCETFYTKYGDYIARAALWLSALIFIFSFTKKFLR